MPILKKRWLISQLIITKIIYVKIIDSYFCIELLTNINE